mgnify:CR=1 FL=1
MAEDNFSNIINNFKKMLNNNNNSPNNINSSTTQSENQENLNITPEMISNLTNMLKSNNSETEKQTESNSNNTNKQQDSTFNNIDFETIMKIKSIMETLNKKDDPRSNLLYSLKPYLRESKQKKLDQYVNLLKITEISNLFKNGKGDGN